MACISIRGEHGSGAPEIARLLAWRLGWEYVDKEIIAMVAARTHARESNVALKEEPPATLIGRIAESLSRAAFPGPYGTTVWLPDMEPPLDDDEYLRALSAVIKSLADGGSIVVLGRGSQFILNGRLDTFHVLVVADLAVRIRRVMATQCVDADVAKAKIEHVDATRRAFIKQYFSAEIQDPKHYDMVLNTTHLGFDTCVQTIQRSIGLAGLTAGAA